MCTAERAAFQICTAPFPMCRVMQNKQKLIFRNEAEMSSQVKFTRTVSRDKLAITLL